MNVIEALQVLKAGKRIRNTTWKDNDYLVIEDDTIMYVSPECNYKEPELFTVTADSLSMDDLWEVLPSPILDEVEKNYLENVLRPFKDNVTYVAKNHVYADYKHAFIAFYLDNDDSCAMPYFESDTMYNGMLIDKEYTLEELGLFK